jgi:6-phosphogluconate dehydrogenase
MDIGMIGLGRMGGAMARRLMKAGHACIVFDTSAKSVAALAAQGATGAGSIAELVRRLAPPRAIWLMVPAAAVDAALADLVPHLARGDAVVDGGNSYYVDDLRRAEALAAHGIEYVDCGTSGGVLGEQRGYCLMIGGSDAAVRRLDPVFKALAPGRDAAPSTPGRKAGQGTADEGYLHCGAAGAGHFVKMIHNGIEYGLMAAYAEGLNVLRNADVGRRHRDVDAETTPLRHPERYRYAFPIAEIAEVWRRGSVIASWLLDLTAAALAEQPGLDSFAGRVSDSGEGRWTIEAAIDESTPVPVLSAALYQRFSSRGEDDFAERVLSAMRFRFGGHEERVPT